LASKLKDFNVTVGPIVDSTRKIYRKRLSMSMDERASGKKQTILAPPTNETLTQHSEIIDPVHQPRKDPEIFEKNTIDANAEPWLRESEFSTNDEDDPYQPSGITSPSSESTWKTQIDTINGVDSIDDLNKAAEIPSSNTVWTNIRQRYAGSSKEANENGSRFTPTPRRSIHSYKVTETSKETVTKMKDGTIARDFEYKKMTSNDQEEMGGYRKIVKLIPSLFLILIVLAVAYYIYISRK